MRSRFRFAALLACLLAAPAAAAPVHTTYLWHMHQPIYWPDQSTWYGAGYEHAYETITLGHSQNDEFSIFNSDDRVRDYQDYPKLALQSVLDLPDAGAQVSFAGSLIQNLNSLGTAGWNGGRYASNWWQPYRDAMGWTTSGGRRRLDPVLVGFHHPIAPLIDDAVFRRMLSTQRAIAGPTWGAGPAASAGFFPAEMCFSERMIPALVEAGVEWTIVPDVHVARACAGYPWAANQDNADPPNRADQINPPQSSWYSQSISRGVTTKVPVPYGLRPHRAQHVDPSTGAVSSLVVVPAANGMSWNEGYGLYGTGEIDAIAAQNDPAKPMLIVFAHDGDNAWSGGHSYYNENVSQFSHAAAVKGYEPTTIAEYLADHPVDPTDVVHVEDGGWVNADGDFGSPQFINWNWPLVNASGQFDIPNGWAEDERNWAVLTAAVNRVVTAEQVAGAAPVAARIVDPTLPGATAVEKAWHFLLAGHESGYMYYGAVLDMEIKPTLAANRAVAHADPVILGGPDTTPPTVWLPQRLPWNPGGKGGGALWGYPGGAGADMTSDFWVWTFAYDVSGIESAVLKYRVDVDGANPLASIQNDTYAGGAEVGAWQSLAMTRRAFPAGDVHDRPDIDFTVMPDYVAEQFSVQVTGLSDVLVDYYVEVRDALGNVKRSPIQHVWVGASSGGPGGGGPAVRWSPANPTPCEALMISYDPVAGALPDATNPVRIHIGHSNWASGTVGTFPMTFDADSARWFYTYPIPHGATQVDFVFTDGAGQWDNNGGADWHVPVGAGAPPPYAMDGALDADVPVVASCGGLELRAEYDGRWLYVAAPPASAAQGRDHFVFVALDTARATRAAPWAKAGTSAAWDWFLAAESSNAFVGWFGAAGGAPLALTTKASGAVLEGVLDLEALLCATPPAVWVGFAAYQTPDGGALAAQAPCGDGDGAVEAVEWALLQLPPVGVSPAPAPVLGGGPRIELLTANPSRGAIRARVDAGAVERVSVDFVDVTGRVVERWGEGATPRIVEVSKPVTPGVYFMVARGDGRTTSKRVAIVR